MNSLIRNVKSLKNTFIWPLVSRPTTPSLSEILVHPKSASKHVRSKSAPLFNRQLNLEQLYSYHTGNNASTLLQNNNVNLEHSKTTRTLTQKCTKKNRSIYPWTQAFAKFRGGGKQQVAKFHENAADDRDALGVRCPNPCAKTVGGKPKKGSRKNPAVVKPFKSVKEIVKFQDELKLRLQEKTNRDVHQRNKISTFCFNIKCKSCGSKPPQNTNTKGGESCNQKRPYATKTLPQPTSTKCTECCDQKRSYSTKRTRRPTRKTSKKKITRNNSNDILLPPFSQGQTKSYIDANESAEANKKANMYEENVYKLETIPKFNKKNTKMTLFNLVKKGSQKPSSKEEPVKDEEIVSWWENAKESNRALFYLVNKNMKKQIVQNTSKSSDGNAEEQTNEQDVDVNEKVKRTGYICDPPIFACKDYKFEVITSGPKIETLEQNVSTLRLATPKHIKNNNYQFKDYKKIEPPNYPLNYVRRTPQNLKDLMQTEEAKDEEISIDANNVLEKSEENEELGEETKPDTVESTIRQKSFENTMKFREKDNIYVRSSHDMSTLDGQKRPCSSESRLHCGQSGLVTNRNLVDNDMFFVHPKDRLNQNFYEELLSRPQKTESCIALDEKTTYELAQGIRTLLQPVIQKEFLKYDEVVTAIDRLEKKLAIYLDEKEPLTNINKTPPRLPYNKKEPIKDPHKLPQIEDPILVSKNLQDPMKKETIKDPSSDTRYVDPNLTVSEVFCKKKKLSDTLPPLRPQKKSSDNSDATKTSDSSNTYDPRIKTLTKKDHLRKKKADKTISGSKHESPVSKELADKLKQMLKGDCSGTQKIPSPKGTPPKATASKGDCIKIPNPCKDSKTDTCKNNPQIKPTDYCKDSKKSDTCKNNTPKPPVDYCKDSKKTDTCKNTPPKQAASKTDTCKSNAPKQTSSKNDFCKNQSPKKVAADPCKKDDPCKKQDPCKKDDTCGKPDPCKKQDPCKKEDSCGKPDPCKKQDPCKKEDSCGKPDPCKKQDPCKTEDPCGKPDPCKKQDPCKKECAKQDPCKKKGSPCKEYEIFQKQDTCKKPDPCGKPDPCKDPCKKASTCEKKDPCRKMDPCKSSCEAVDPCKKKDPCRKDDPCDPCKKPSCTNDTLPNLCLSEKSSTGKKSSEIGLYPYKSLNYTSKNGINSCEKEKPCPLVDPFKIQHCSGVEPAKKPEPTSPASKAQSKIPISRPNTAPSDKRCEKPELSGAEVNCPKRRALSVRPSTCKSELYKGACVNDDVVTVEPKCSEVKYMPNLQVKGKGVEYCMQNPMPEDCPLKMMNKPKPKVKDMICVQKPCGSQPKILRQPRICPVGCPKKVDDVNLFTFGMEGMQEIKTPDPTSQSSCRPAKVEREAIQATFQKGLVKELYTMKPPKKKIREEENNRYCPRDNAAPAPPKPLFEACKKPPEQCRQSASFGPSTKHTWNPVDVKNKKPAGVGAKPKKPDPSCPDNDPTLFGVCKEVCKSIWGTGKPSKGGKKAAPTTSTSSSAVFSRNHESGVLGGHSSGNNNDGKGKPKMFCIALNIPKKVDNNVNIKGSSSCPNIKGFRSLSKGCVSSKRNKYPWIELEIEKRTKRSKFLKDTLSWSPDGVKDLQKYPDELITLVDTPQRNTRPPNKLKGGYKFCGNTFERITNKKMTSDMIRKKLQDDKKSENNKVKNYGLMVGGAYVNKVNRECLFDVVKRHNLSPKSKCNHWKKEYPCKTAPIVKRYKSGGMDDLPLKKYKCIEKLKEEKSYKVETTETSTKASEDQPSQNQLNENEDREERSMLNENPIVNFVKSSLSKAENALRKPEEFILLDTKETLCPIRDKYPDVKAERIFVNDVVNSKINFMNCTENLCNKNAPINHPCLAPKKKKELRHPCFKICASSKRKIPKTKCRSTIEKYPWTEQSCKKVGMKVIEEPCPEVVKFKTFNPSRDLAKKNPCIGRPGYRNNFDLKCSNKQNPCAKQKEEPCGKNQKEDPCAKLNKGKADTCAKLAKQKEDSFGQIKEDPCAKLAKQKEEPCGKKHEDPCAKLDKGKTDPCAKLAKHKEDSCGQIKEDPCAKLAKQKEEPCGKKQEDPCAKLDKGQTDPCAKLAKHKEDSCGQIKEDPCAKLAKQKEEPCGKKQEDPCAKLNKGKTDPCGKLDISKEDPCGKQGKQKEDPCAHLATQIEDPCAKLSKQKEDPCGKQKEDPCGKHIDKSCEDTAKKDTCAPKRPKKNFCCERRNKNNNKKNPCASKDAGPKKPPVTVCPPPCAAKSEAKSTGDKSSGENQPKFNLCPPPCATKKSSCDNSTKEKPKSKICKHPWAKKKGSKSSCGQSSTEKPKTTCSSTCVPKKKDSTPSCDKSSTDKPKATVCPPPCAAIKESKFTCEKPSTEKSTCSSTCVTKKKESKSCDKSSTDKPRVAICPPPCANIKDSTSTCDNLSEKPKTTPCPPTCAATKETKSTCDKSSEKSICPPPSKKETCGKSSQEKPKPIVCPPPCVVQPKKEPKSTKSPCTKKVKKTVSCYVSFGRKEKQKEVKECKSDTSARSKSKYPWADPKSDISSCKSKQHPKCKDAPDCTCGPSCACDHQQKSKSPDASKHLEKYYKEIAGKGCSSSGTGGNVEKELKAKLSGIKKRPMEIKEKEPPRKMPSCGGSNGSKSDEKLKDFFKNISGKGCK